MTKNMTTGEMNQLTQRFNQIMGASITLRNKRLGGLIKDIFQTYGYECNDPHVTGMLSTVWEARYGVRLP